MDFIEYYHWSERWLMDNLPPTSLVSYQSPVYDPYEINPDHYQECYDYPTEPFINHSVLDNFYHTYEPDIYHSGDDTNTDTDSDLDYD